MAPTTRPVAAPGEIDAAYGQLEAAYRGAYEEAAGLDELNRALVYHYLAGASQGAAGEVRLRGSNVVAERAGKFAEAAAEKDDLAAGFSLAKFVVKTVLPGSALLSLGAGALAFLIHLIGDANQTGYQAGVGLAG